MERSKTGAQCLYEQHDIHKFYAYVFNIWTSLATLDPRYTIALNKTDQKSCSIRVNIINFIHQSKSFKTKTIYAKNKKFRWTDHKIWSNKPILEKKLTFWPQILRSIWVEIINFIHQCKSFKAKIIHAKNKKIGWAALKIWWNRPKSGKSLTFWPQKLHLIWVEITNFIDQFKSFKCKTIHAKKSKKLDEQNLRYG